MKQDLRRCVSSSLSQNSFNTNIKKYLRGLQVEIVILMGVTKNNIAK